MQSEPFATPAPRSLSDTLDLTDQALSRPPPVDAAIPLDGFEWDPSSGHFVDRAAGYVFDPANSVFRQTETQHEYVFDKDARLFRPRQPEGTLRQLVPSRAAGASGSSVTFKRDFSGFRTRSPWRESKSKG